MQHKSNSLAQNATFYPEIDSVIRELDLELAEKRKVPEPSKSEGKLTPVVDDMLEYYSQRAVEL